MIAFAQFALPLHRKQSASALDAEGKEKVTYPISLHRPATTYQHRVSWQAALQWPSNDEEFFRERYKADNYSGMEFYSLGRKQFLLEVSLGLGAYQGSYLFIYLDENGETPRWNIITFR